MQGNLAQPDCLACGYMTFLLQLETIFLSYEYLYVEGMFLLLSC